MNNYATIPVPPPPLPQSNRDRLAAAYFDFVRATAEAKPKPKSKRTVAAQPKEPAPVRLAMLPPPMVTGQAALVSSAGSCSVEVVR